MIHNTSADSGDAGTARQTCDSDHPEPVDVTENGLPMSELSLSVKAVLLSPFITKQHEKVIHALVTSPNQDKPTNRFVKEWVDRSCRSLSTTVKPPV